METFLNAYTAMFSDLVFLHNPRDLLLYTRLEYPTSRLLRCLFPALRNIHVRPGRECIFHSRGVLF